MGSGSYRDKQLNAMKWCMGLLSLTFVGGLFAPFGIFLYHEVKDRKEINLQRGQIEIIEKERLDLEEEIAFKFDKISFSKIQKSDKAEASLDVKFTAISDDKRFVIEETFFGMVDLVKKNPEERDTQIEMLKRINNNYDELRVKSLLEVNEIGGAAGVSGDANKVGSTAVDVAGELADVKIASGIIDIDLNKVKAEVTGKQKQVASWQVENAKKELEKTKPSWFFSGLV
jgi:hypothetical protein